MLPCSTWRLIFNQEYFEEKPTRRLYQAVVERFLTILDEDDEDLVENIANDYNQIGFSTKEKTKTVWPPWPWPPWDGDDDDGGDGGKDKPPKHRDIRKLAEKVVNFERKMAKASLDL